MKMLGSQHHIPTSEATLGAANECVIAVDCAFEILSWGGGGNSNIFWNFHPEPLGKMLPHLRSIFFKGVGSTSNYIIVSFFWGSSEMDEQTLKIEMRLKNALESTVSFFTKMRDVL